MSMATNSTARQRNSSVAERAASVANDFHGIGDAAKQMASHSVAAVRDTALNYLDEGGSLVRRFGDNIQSRVTRQPVKSLLVAAGVGFLLGAIWTRR